MRPDFAAADAALGGTALFDIDDREREIPVMDDVMRTRNGLPGTRTAFTALRLGRSLAVALLSGVLCFYGSGCTSVMAPISGIPVNRLPPELLVQPRANWQEIDLAKLRQEPPPAYLLDSGDLLGVYIEGVLGKVEEPPPVHFPEEGSDLPPAVGFPVPIRDDGTISLPLAEPMNLRGLTLPQAEDAIRRAYTVDKQILQPGRDRILVTLMRERTYRVIVVRQDGQQQGLAISGGGRGGIGPGAQAVIAGNEQTGTGHVLDLPAYKNDLLHALAETGGLPGLNAKNEVKILRGRHADAAKRDAFVAAFYAMHANDPCFCPPPLPEDPATLLIPLRHPPGQIPQVNPADIILEDGDIVYIESRDTEVFYTGGLLPGGQFPLPRDYDLDIFGAIAIAGQGVGGFAGGAGGGGLIGGLGGVPPSKAYVLRKVPCRGEVIIAVDLNDALVNSRERILIAPGDTIILRYACEEELANFGIFVGVTYGVTQLFSAFSD